MKDKLTRSEATTRVWANLTEEERTARVEKIRAGQHKAAAACRSKTDRWKQTEVQIEDLFSGDVEILQLQEIVEKYSIPYQTARNMVSGKYGTQGNIWRKQYRITEIEND